MKLNTEQTMVWAALAGCLALSPRLIGAEDSGGKKGSVSVTLGALPSATVLAGKKLTLSLDAKDLKRSQSDAKKSGMVYYQWRRNGVEIPGATKRDYIITNVGLEDAASYTLLLTGSTEAESAPVHLSVFFHHTTNSNGGTMRTPIGDFINQNNAICDATGWTKYKVYLPFDGPFKQSPKSVDFPNTSDGTKLTFDTCSVTNRSTIDTAVRVRKNFGSMSELCCNNNEPNCQPSTLLSRCASVPLQTNKNYRVTIYLKNFGSQPHVTFNWLYHN